MSDSDNGRDSYSHNDSGSDRVTVYDSDNVNVNININDNDKDNDNDNDNDNGNDNDNRLTSTHVSNFEGNRVTCIFSLQAQQEPAFNHFCMYFGHLRPLFYFCHCKHLGPTYIPHRQWSIAD